MPRRSRRSGPLRALKQAIALLGLPAPVRRFYVRALGRALLMRDTLTLRSAVRPRELATLARLAADRGTIVEIGTGSGWSTGALALSGPAAVVHSLDPKPRPHVDVYLGLLPEEARRRLHRHVARGDQPPAGIDAPDLVFVDGSHKFDFVVADFRAWQPRLAEGGVVAFHDYQDPSHPGVEDAISHLGLRGEDAWNMFIWRGW